MEQFLKSTGRETGLTDQVCWPFLPGAEYIYNGGRGLDKNDVNLPVIFKGKTGARQYRFDVIGHPPQGAPRFISADDVLYRIKPLNPAQVTRGPEWLKPTAKLMTIYGALVQRNQLPGHNTAEARRGGGYMLADAFCRLYAGETWAETDYPVTLENFGVDHWPAYCKNQNDYKI